MSGDPKTDALNHRIDVLQDQLNQRIRENERLARELSEARITIAAQAEDIYELEGEAEGIPPFYPPLSSSAYVPMPEWDNRGWSVT